MTAHPQHSSVPSAGGSGGRNSQTTSLATTTSRPPPGLVSPGYHQSPAGLQDLELLRELDKKKTVDRNTRRQADKPDDNVRF